MALLFVSHSSHDRDEAERVAKRLRVEGFAALFLDFDPAYGLPAGRDWQRELYAQLRKSDGVIFLASAASVASQWCFAEVSHARSLGRPVFPLRLEAGVRLGLLDDVQWIDLSEGETAFARLFAGLRRAGLDPADSFAWDPTRSPYPGLESFSGDDVAVFFGRDDEIDQLMELLQPTLQRGAGRFVAVVGPSGSGKSSLVRAGLLPRLERLDSRWVVLPALVPGQHPTRSLAYCVAAAFAARGQPRPQDEIAAVLRRGGAGLVDLAGELGELVSAAVPGGMPSSRVNVLVVIDQAEELLIRTGITEQQGFLGLLRDALGDDSPVWVVATVRSEFLSTAPERAGLAEVIGDSLVIEPLSRARLPIVIQQPAQRAGLQFAPGLVEQMVEETTGGDALPLLAFMLRELYQEAGADGYVTVAEYQELGGVVGALQSRAGQVSDELDRRGRGDLVLPTLTRFAVVSGDAEPTTRRIPRSALGPHEQAVADAFVEARLLTSAADADGERVVGVAHEALLRQWRPLREAIEASRASLRMRSDVERLAADWDQGGRDDSYLPHGTRLSAFDEWAVDHSSEVGPLERQFIDAAKTSASRQLEAARRSNRQLRTLALGLAIVLVLALASGGLAGWLGQRASRNQRIAIARGMVAEADRVLDSDPRSALRLGAAAERLDPSPATRAGLLQILTSSSYRGTLGSRGPAVGLLRALVGSLGVLAPDGKMVLTARKDGTVILWDLSDRTRPRPSEPLVGHSGQVTAAAFAGDGKTLATVSADAVIFWDISDRGRPRPLSTYGTGVQSPIPSVAHTELIAYAPDGRTLVTAFGSVVDLWDVTDRARPRRLERSIIDTIAGVTSMAFGPRNTVLAIGADDGTVVLWNLSDRDHPERLGELLADESGQDISLGVSSMAFTSDVTTLATVGALDEDVILWDVSDRNRPRRLGKPLRHKSGVEAVTLSPDGRTLATAGADKTITLWDVSKRQSAHIIGKPLTGHTDSVTSVGFAPDGHTIISASNDETVMLWDIGNRDYPHRLGEPLQGHAKAVASVAFAPNGTTLASGSEDGSVILWDLSNREHPRRLGEPLIDHTSQVDSIAFAADGETMATGGSDRTIILWDVSDHEHPRRLGQPLRGNGLGPLVSVEFAPHGHILAVASDSDVILWDVTDRIHPRRVGSLANAGSVEAVAFAADGRFLAIGNFDFHVALWDLSDPRHPQRLDDALTGFEWAVTALAFTRNGGLLAAGSVDHITLFDISDPSQPNRLGQPLRGRGDVTALAFTGNGNTLVTGGGNGFDLWDFTDRSHPRLLGQPPLGRLGEVDALALAADGHTVATAGKADRTVTLWDLTPLEALRSNSVEEACIRAGGPLDTAMWNIYAPGLRYQNTCRG